MKTVEDTTMTTDIGGTRVRTLSHYLIFKKPRTTIFSTENPYREETLVTITWDTSDPHILRQIDRRVIEALREHGFAPFKEAAQLLNSNVETKITAGKLKLLMLLSREISGHVTSVA